MTRVLIVTAQHFATQPRKVDLHFMAEALNKRGIAVDFLSTRLSLLSRLGKDERWAFARHRRHNQWTEISPLMGEFIWVTALHPIRTGKKLVDRMTAGLARAQSRKLPAKVQARLGDYTHILVESGMSILTIPTLRKLAPKARIIYHAADRLATIGAHPAAHAVLRDHIADVDIVHIMAEAIAEDIPAGAKILHLPHGIDKTAFDRASANPFSRGKNAVSVGDMLFDADAIRTMAVAYPDWDFHLFGRLARLADAPPNVIAHGEQPFETVTPYIKFADIGIAPYKARQDADYLSQSSLKMIQYSYCRLPIVAPRFAASGRSHVLAYDPGNRPSTIAAFKAASTFNRDKIDPSSVLSWEEKTERLFGLDAASPLHPAATRDLAKHGTD